MDLSEKTDLPLREQHHGIMVGTSPKHCEPIVKTWKTLACKTYQNIGNITEFNCEVQMMGSMSSGLNFENES